MYAPLTNKFPLFSQHYFYTDGKDYEFTVIGHYISDLGRDNVIALFKNPIADLNIVSGEAIVLDTLYISGPVV
jgi:hypothetical protein